MSAKHAIWRERRPGIRGRQAHAASPRRSIVAAVPAVRDPDGFRESCLRDHSDRDRLTVKQRVVACGFDAVADRVAEVQHLSKPELAFVGGDDRRLDANAALDERLERDSRRGAGEQRWNERGPLQSISVPSAITPCLITSARPARSSRAGSVASVDGSIMTTAGG